MVVLLLAGIATSLYFTSAPSTVSTSAIRKIGTLGGVRAKEPRRNGIVTLEKRERDCVLNGEPSSGVPSRVWRAVGRMKHTA